MLTVTGLSRKESLVPHRPKAADNLLTGRVGRNVSKCATCLSKILRDVKMQTLIHVHACTHICMHVIGFSQFPLKSQPEAVNFSISGFQNNDTYATEIRNASTLVTHLHH